MLDYVNPDHPSSFHRLNGLVYWNRHGGNWMRQMNSFNSSTGKTEKVFCCDKNGLRIPIDKPKIPDIKIIFLNNVF